MKTVPTNDTNMPWIEKYRPDTLSELILPQDKQNLLSEFFKDNQFPNFLFYGPPGVGKTSTILACAREYYRDNFRIMVMELNASDDRGIDIVRTKIKDFATSVWTLTGDTNGKPKLVILDEVDGISSLAQSALLVEMESNMANARFCLICNNIHKLNPAIQSRCLKLRFSPLTYKEMFDKLKNVSILESLNICDDALNALIELSHGDMRNALNMLQQINMLKQTTSGDNTIDEDFVYLSMGLPLPSEIVEIYQLLKNRSVNVSTTYQIIYKTLLDQCLDLHSVIQGLHKLVMKELDTGDNQSQSAPDNRLMQILAKLGEIETRVVDQCSTSIQLAAIVASFKQIYCYDQPGGQVKMDE